MPIDLKRILRPGKRPPGNGRSRPDSGSLSARWAAWTRRLGAGLKSLVRRLARLPERLRRKRSPTQHRVERDHSYLFTARNHAGSRNRRYTVHVPTGYDGLSPLPLVMVLHGCLQTHLDIRRISGFDAIADREGFLLVYPYITSYRGLRGRNCWGWWFRNEITPGQGEVEDLWRIIEEVRGRYPVDPRRIHVTGLSAGGGMAVAMMVAHVDRIASGAVVAGAAYSETAQAVGFVGYNKGRFKPVGKIVQAMNAAMGARKRPLPILIVHSHDDATINIQSALNIRDSWAACFECDLQEAGKRRGESGSTRWEQIRYRGGPTGTLIETLFLSGPGHGWYGGAPGDFSYPEAPDISTMIWSFFADHAHEASAETLARRQPPEGPPTSERAHSS